MLWEFYLSMSRMANRGKNTKLNFIQFSQISTINKRPQKANSSNKKSKKICILSRTQSKNLSCK
jgi:hypothetical protein